MFSKLFKITQTLGSKLTDCYKRRFQLEVHCPAASVPAWFLGDCAFLTTVRSEVYLCAVQLEEYLNFPHLICLMKTDF